MALFSFSCYQQVGNLCNSQLLTTAVPAAPEKERHPPTAGGELARPVPAARDGEKSASSLVFAAETIKTDQVEREKEETGVEEIKQLEVNLNIVKKKRKAKLQISYPLTRAFLVR